MVAPPIPTCASENIDSIDVFIALTNDDEANIMSSLLAKN